MEYTEQLLAVMQDKAESRGGVAVLGESSMIAAGIHRHEPFLLHNIWSYITQHVAKALHMSAHMCGFWFSSLPKHMIHMKVLGGYWGLGLPGLL